MNRIGKIADLLRDISHASRSMCYSASLFAMSVSLNNCFFHDEIGDVFTNLSFLTVTDSATYKTPLLNALSDLHDSLWRHQGMHMKSKFTAEGLQLYLSDYYKRYLAKYYNVRPAELPDVSDLLDAPEVPVFKLIVLRDEASTLPKEAKGRAANIWEFFSEAFDGKIRPYDTIRGKAEIYPKTWTGVWMASTKIFYEEIPEQFWEQGWAYRTLFNKLEPTEYAPITLQIDRDIILQEIANELEPLVKVTKAVCTDEYLNSYNEICRPIHDQLQEADKESDATANDIPIEIKARKKWPVLLHKLAMIHCASRDGIKEEDGKKYLLIELRDLKAAERDLEMFRENFVSAYNTYLLKKTVNMRTEKLTKDAEMILKYINEAPENERYTYRAETRENKYEQEETLYYPIKDFQGRFVKKSFLYGKKGFAKKSLDAILDTMEDAEQIVRIKCESQGTYKKTELIGLYRDLPSPPQNTETSKEKESKPSGLMEVKLSDLSPEMWKRIFKNAKPRDKLEGNR